MTRDLCSGLLVSMTNLGCRAFLTAYKIDITNYQTRWTGEGDQQVEMDPSG